MVPVAARSRSLAPRFAESISHQDVVHEQRQVCSSRRRVVDRHRREVGGEARPPERRAFLPRRWHTRMACAATERLLARCDAVTDEALLAVGAGLTRLDGPSPILATWLHRPSHRCRPRRRSLHRRQARRRRDRRPYSRRLRVRWHASAWRRRRRHSASALCSATLSARNSSSSAKTRFCNDTGSADTAL